MRRARTTLRLLVAATLGWGLLWAVVAPVMAQGTPDPDPATIVVYKQYCEDDARAGEVDFLVGSFPSSGTADECELASPEDDNEVMFTLMDVERGIPYPPLTTVDGVAVFELIFPGDFTLSEDGQGAVSGAFVVASGNTHHITVTNFVPATDTPTPTNTPDPTDAPKPTKTPTSGSGGQTPKPTKTPTSGGGVVNPPVVVTDRTPVTIATTPSRAVATTVSVSGVATRTTTSAVVRSSPISVTALPATGEGSVDVAPLSTITMMLLGALMLIALGISMFRRRAG